MERNRRSAGRERAAEAAQRHWKDKVWNVAPESVPVRAEQHLNPPGQCTSGRGLHVPESDSGLLFHAAGGEESDGVWG